eukprot:scaffold624_cov402-Prasinococcus_capsulatus_cf.AAC.38
MWPLGRRPMQLAVPVRADWLAGASSAGSPHPFPTGVARSVGAGASAVAAGASVAPRWAGGGRRARERN